MLSALSCWLYSIDVLIQRDKASAHPEATSGHSSSIFLNEIVMTSSRLMVGDDAAPSFDECGFLMLVWIKTGASNPASEAAALRTSGNLSIAASLNSLTTSSIALSSMAPFKTRHADPSTGRSFIDDWRHATATAQAAWMDATL